MATTAIESLVRTELNEHPYGSWKDMKYFCNYHIPKEQRFDYKLKPLEDLDKADWYLERLREEVMADGKS